jgi:ferrochelatase
MSEAPATAAHTSASKAADPASPRTALLLVNLGTPDAPTPEAVRPYLKEFLSDPRVINMPALGRWLLLNLIILPRRPAKSAEAYQRVWTDEGSPLLLATQRLSEKVAKLLAAQQAATGAEPVRVAWAMRYGNPGLPEVLDQLHKEGIDRLVVFPLYPQYASATSGSTIERVIELAKERWLVPHLTFVPHFYDDEGYLGPQVAVAEQGLKDFQADHVVFSFHGVPEEHIELGDPTGNYCLKKDDDYSCCERVGPENRLCYRAHCVQTARKLGDRFGLKKDAYSITFQSRLGKQVWLGPYTDHTVDELAKKGTKRLAMFSPAFVADCLETLEELGMEAKESFEEHGGEAFWLAPCVNDDDRWAEGVIDIARKTSAWLGPAPDKAD